MQYDVFISYSRKDSFIADKICKALDDNGISYFIDKQGIIAGMEFPETLANAILSSRIFLFLASDNSYKSKFTRNEVVYAFNKKEGACIIPYIIDGSKLPADLEFTFCSINWRNINEHPIESSLVQDIQKILNVCFWNEYREEKPSIMFEDGIELDSSKIEQYQIKAESGNPLFQFKLGMCYINALGVEKDLNKAFYWIREAAVQNMPIASFHLALFYQEGVVFKQDYSEAFKWFLKSANEGYLKAQHNVAYHYHMGLGVPADYQKAFYWYNMAAVSGFALSQYNLAQCYHKGEGSEINNDLYIHWLSVSAQSGCDEALFMLSEEYFHGNIVKKDLCKAFKGYKRLSENGFTQSKFKLAHCYAQGIGTEIDKTQAERWLIESAQDENPDAIFLLGISYYRGDIVTPQDYNKAVYYLNKAASSGNNEALFLIGNCYMDGDGINKDVVKAFNIMCRCAEAGNYLAQYNVGISYLEGIGTEKNSVLAAKWMNKSAKYGYVGAQYCMALMYEKGEGVPQSFKKAYDYWGLAAKQNMIEAQFKIAEYLMFGLHGKKDVEASLKILSELQARRFPPALFLMGSFFIRDKATYNKGVALIKQAAMLGYHNAVEYITQNNI